MSSNLRNAVVLVTSRDPEEAGFGTAFVIDRRETQTYLLTCSHVVEMVGGEEWINVGGLAAKVVAIGEKSSTDLAVLVVEGLLDKAILPLGRSVQVSSQFTTSGYRKSAGTMQRRESTGKLGQQRVDLAHQGTLLPAWDLEITGGARLESGCSGSPIVDQTGSVIGVAIHQQDDSGRQGLAIAISALPIIWPDIPPALLPAEPISSQPVPWWQFWQRPQVGDRSLPIAFGMTFLMALGGMGVRYTGVLQSYELADYDAMLHSRTRFDTPDDRLLIIEITDDDLKTYADPQDKHIISNETLAQVLQKLDTYNPQAVIGLDLFRHGLPAAPRTPQTTYLEKRYQNPDDSLITVCEFPDPTRPGHKEFAAPVPSSFEQRIGFGNSVGYLTTNPRQKEPVFRRHLLAASTKGRDTACVTPFAFSLQVAARYMNKPADAFFNGSTLGNVPFFPIETRYGGYQGIDAQGYQMLLNYEAPGKDPKKIAEIMSLTEFLKTEPSPEKLRRIQAGIVLIGSAVTEIAVGQKERIDLWQTPFSPPGEADTPGVVLQAQAISQILRAVQDQDSKALMRVLPSWSSSEPGINQRLILQWGDFLWVWFWAFVSWLGWVVSMRSRSLRSRIIGFCVWIVIVQVIMWGCSNFLFSQSLWVPFVPAFLAIILAGLGGLGYTVWQVNQTLSRPPS